MGLFHYHSNIPAPSEVDAPVNPVNAPVNLVNAPVNPPGLAWVFFDASFEAERYLNRKRKNR